MVKRQLSEEEADSQAIQTAVNLAPHDMLLVPVWVTGATVHEKMYVADEDLQVRGLRWYVEVTLENLNDQSTAVALYRVWSDHGHWHALLVGGLF